MKCKGVQLHTEGSKRAHCTSEVCISGGFYRKRSRRPESSSQPPPHRCGAGVVWVGAAGRSVGLLGVGAAGLFAGFLGVGAAGLSVGFLGAGLAGPFGGVGPAGLAGPVDAGLVGAGACVGALAGAGLVGAALVGVAGAFVGALGAGVVGWLGAVAPRFLGAAWGAGVALISLRARSRASCGSEAYSSKVALLNTKGELVVASASVASLEVRQLVYLNMILVSSDLAEGALSP